MDALLKEINERRMVMRIKSVGDRHAPATIVSNDDLRTRIHTTTHRHDQLILIGDFSAQVGRDYAASERVIWYQGTGNENSKGSFLLTMCTEFQLAIRKTLFRIGGVTTRETLTFDRLQSS